MKAENIVVKSSKWRESDIPTLYGDEPVYFTDETDISRLMAELEIYPSTSAARRAGRMGEIPKGWTVCVELPSFFQDIPTRAQWPFEEHPLFSRCGFIIPISEIMSTKIYEK